MLTGTRAFQKPTSAETMNAILNEDPPGVSQVASNLPPGLQRIVNRCLQKSPEHRFQHASDLAFALESLSESGSSGTLAAQGQAAKKNSIRVATAVALLVIGSAAIIWWNRLRAVPVVEAVTQLTDDGLPKGGDLVTDGSRIYFTEEVSGSGKIAQVSVAGGETSIVPTRLADMRVAGIAPDGTSLLVHVRESNWQLWTLPLPTGEARRLGTISAASPSYLPDGRLLFIQDAGLHVAERDGSNIQKLLTVPNGANCPTASPDGKIIVFAAGDSLSRYFEVKVDGSGVHEIMKGTADAELSCPVWTPDGKHLIYEVVHPSKFSADIWAVAARTGLWRRYTEATQLTNGPLAYVSKAIFSRDGKHIFTIGIKPRGELVRYDQTTKQFVPFLGGISAIDPSFSRDGQWVAYTSTSEHTLWRSRADGTDRLQLTFPPMQVAWPVISQDGRQVAFQVIGDGGYVISTNGGQPRRFADKNSGGGSLSPDGNSIAFAGWIRGKQGDPRIWELRTLNLTNGALSSLRSSQNVLGPFWVNQNTLVAAAGEVDQVEWTTKLVSFDLKTGKWTDLVSDAIGNWMPSPDGKYLYYTTRGPEPRAMRIRLADRQVETLTSLKNLHRFWDFEEGTQISVAPDGSPVFTRDIGTREIYALTVKWP
jgi:Tol biopolymer transport system component